MAYDLMLKDAVGSGRAKDRAEANVRSLHALPALRLCEVYSGFHEPDDLDCDALTELLEEEHAAVERFRSFCGALGRAAYSELVDFARRHQLRVWDPQAGTAIDLANPGRLPPMWK